MYKVSTYVIDKQLRLLGITMLYGDMKICNDNKGIEYDKNVVRDNKDVIVNDTR